MDITRSKKKITKGSILAFVLSVLSYFSRAFAIIAVLVAAKDMLKDRKLKAGRHFFSIMAITVSTVMFFGKNIITNHFDLQRAFEIGNKDSLVYTVDEEVFKNMDSDIEGYSLYDKMAAGLDEEDGSDTDGDGLTDKEEIEQYGTDPLKKSSSGDLIPDSYKVSMGLSTDTKYDINTCNYKDYGLKEIYCAPANITIDTGDVNNAFASIYERARYDGETKAVAGYDFVDVEGDITVDFSEYVDDDSAYVAYLETLSGERKELSIKNGVVHGTLDGAFGNVSIFDKYALLQNNEALLFVPSGWIGELWDYLLNGGSSKDRHIYIYEKSTKDNNPERGMFLSQKLSERFGKSIVVHHTYLSGVEFEARKMAFDSVLKLTKLGDKYWAWDDSMSETENIWSYAIKKIFATCYVYQHLEANDWDYSEAAVVQIAYVGEGLQFYKDMVMTGKFWELTNRKTVVGANFDLVDDTFAFRNFETGINGGNCAGIAKFIASRYNGDYLQRKTDGGIHIRYGMAGYGFRHHGYDLMDKKYDAMFDNTISLKTIQVDDNGMPDQNVQDACVVQWAILNDDYAFVRDKLNNDVEVLDKLRKYLQSDRIAIVSLWGKKNSLVDAGHAINVYGIEETNDPNVIYLLVYDSNTTCSEDREGYKDAYLIKVTTVKNWYGKEVFEFYYDASGTEFLSGPKADALGNGTAIYDCKMRFLLAEGGTVENPK